MLYSNTVIFELKVRREGTKSLEQLKNEGTAQLKSYNWQDSWNEDFKLVSNQSLRKILLVYNKDCIEHCEVVN
jgi:hypothetical protein